MGLQTGDENLKDPDPSDEERERTVMTKVKAIDTWSVEGSGGWQGGGSDLAGPEGGKGVGGAGAGAGAGAALRKSEEGDIGDNTLETLAVTKYARGECWDGDGPVVAGGGGGKTIFLALLKRTFSFFGGMSLNGRTRLVRDLKLTQGV